MSSGGGRGCAAHRGNGTRSASTSATARCASPGPFARATSTRSAARCASRMHSGGGRYNPILVVDREAEADQLVDLFRADVIWPIGDARSHFFLTAARDIE